MGIFDAKAGVQKNNEVSGSISILHQDVISSANSRESYEHELDIGVGMGLAVKSNTSLMLEQFRSKEYKSMAKSIGESYSDSPATRTFLDYTQTEQ